MSGNTWKRSGNLILFNISVDVIRPKRSRKYKVRSRIKFLPCFRWRNKTYVDGITRLLSGNRVFSCFWWRIQTYCRVTRFRSGNTIFFLPLAIYRSGSFSTLYPWSSFVITGQVNMLWLCFFFSFLTHTISMPHHVKSHKYKSDIFFTASITLFYYSPFL